MNTSDDLSRRLENARIKGKVEPLLDRFTEVCLDIQEAGFVVYPELHVTKKIENGAMVDKIDNVSYSFLPIPPSELPEAISRVKAKRKELEAIKSKQANSVKEALKKERE